MEDFQHKPVKRLTYKEKVLSGQISGGMKKTKLRFASKKKQKSLSAYASKKTSDDEFQTCKICKIEGTKDTLDRHHTHGRNGENMLKYIYVCRECHDWIHGNPNEAREQGYLFF